jgi:hypothetical protein
MKENYVPGRSPGPFGTTDIFLREMEKND